MTITFDEVKNSNPLLVIYPSGAGGEFVSTVLSLSSESFHNLPYRYLPDINRYNTNCPLDYFTNWTDHNDVSTWINPHFIKQQSGMRYILKDHPMYPCFPLFKKYIPNMSAIYMTPIRETEYFSKLIFIKSSILQKSPITSDFINRHISYKLPTTRIDELLKWANAQQEFWIHELHTANTWLSNGRNLNDLVHIPSLSTYVKLHTTSMTSDLTYMYPAAKNNIKDTRLVNSDSLTTDGIEFWNSIKNIVPDLDLSVALEHTAGWIEKNNKLIEIYDNNNQV